MRLLGDILEPIKEKFRPELPVKQEILKREKEFNKQDSSRESWILNHTYLCKGNLEELKEHPDFDAVGQDIVYILSYYQSPEGKKGPCKKVKVRVLLKDNEQKTRELLEKKLKLDLHSRGSNSGVFYKTFVKDNYLYGEATPAILTGE